MHLGKRCVELFFFIPELFSYILERAFGKFFYFILEGTFFFSYHWWVQEVNDDPISYWAFIRLLWFMNIYNSTVRLYSYTNSKIGDHFCILRAKGYCIGNMVNWIVMGDLYLLKFWFIYNKNEFFGTWMKWNVMNSLHWKWTHVILVSIHHIRALWAWWSCRFSSLVIGIFISFFILFIGMESQVF